MHPDLFSAGPLVFHTYGLFVAIGVLAASAYLFSRAKEIGVRPETMSDTVFVTLMAGFLGARLFYVIHEWAYFRERPLEVIAIWQGGIIFYGGVVFGFLGFMWMVRRVKLKFALMLDLFTIALVLAHGFGRIGCFFNGCCYGIETACPLGVKFPFFISKVHPVQLYESAFCFVLFGVLHYFDTKKKSRAGETAALYFLIYPIGRFLLEYLRGDMPQAFAQLSMAQVTSVIVLALASAASLKYQLFRRDTSR